MTLGNLTGVVNAVDRILTSLRRDNPDKLLSRLADIADDEKALNRLYQDLEQLTRKLAFLRQVPVYMGEDNGTVGREGNGEVQAVRGHSAGGPADGRTMRRRVLVPTAEVRAGRDSEGVAADSE